MSMKKSKKHIGKEKSKRNRGLKNLTLHTDIDTFIENSLEKRKKFRNTT